MYKIYLTFKLQDHSEDLVGIIFFSFCPLNITESIYILGCGIIKSLIYFINLIENDARANHSSQSYWSGQWSVIFHIYPTQNSAKDSERIDRNACAIKCRQICDSLDKDDKKTVDMENKKGKG